MFKLLDVGNDWGNNFGRGRSSGGDRVTAPAPALVRVYTMPYIVFRIHTYRCVLFSISRHCSLAICTRFSSVQDEPQKRFKHASSIFLCSNAFFMQNIKTILYEN